MAPDHHSAFCPGADPEALDFHAAVPEGSFIWPVSAPNVPTQGKQCPPSFTRRPLNVNPTDSPSLIVLNKTWKRGKALEHAVVLPIPCFSSSPDLINQGTVGFLEAR